MLERIPHLQFFSNCYWNQLGGEVYGSIDDAFRQYVSDAARLPDQGRSTRRELYGELMLILESDRYRDWLSSAQTNSETIRAVGGRFIMPQEIRSLLAILDKQDEPDA
jgi:hypothetical protein